MYYYYCYHCHRPFSSRQERHLIQIICISNDENQPKKGTHILKFNFEKISLKICMQSFAIQLIRLKVKWMNNNNQGKKRNEHIFFLQECYAYIYLIDLTWFQLDWSLVFEGEKKKAQTSTATSSFPQKEIYQGKSSENKTSIL